MDIAIVGAGRMGQSIATLAIGRGHRVAAVLDRASILDRSALNGAQVAFEFTSPASADANLTRLIGAGVQIVCGTTGWLPSSTLIESAKTMGVGVIAAPNFSIGVNLFGRVLGEAARILSAMPDLHPVLFELHHRGKKDSPSGTARHLAQRMIEHSSTVDRWVVGAADAVPPPGAMQVSGLRCGFEPGTHVVRFDGACEAITLEHRARNREGFSRGAILAGEWLAGKSGWFSFDDVVESVLRGELPPWEVV